MSGAVAPSSPVVETRAPTTRVGIGRRVLRRPAGIVSIAWLTVVLLACLAATWLAPTDPISQDLAASYSGPTSAHPLGADQLGRDILSRILFGGRSSLLAVAEATAVFVALGLVVGLAAGYWRGWVDRVVTRLCDVMLAMPIVVVLLIILAVFSRNKDAAMITFGVLASAGLIRIVRAETMAVRDDDYVKAARLAGLTDVQVLRRHIAPRVAPSVLIQAALIAASALLVESGLDFLGLGTAPPAPSWGGLVTDASASINRQPWMLVPSGLIILTTTLALGALGDTIRDVVSDRSDLAAPSWRKLITRVTRSSAATDVQAPGSVVAIRGLQVSAGSLTLVREVDLELQPSEIVGIVGESGCGKSLTISAMLRLLPPRVEMSADCYYLDGADALGLSEREMSARRGSVIGYVPQEPVAGFDPAFTIGYQLVELIKHHDNCSKARARDKAKTLLRAVSLEDTDRILQSYPHELSGGMAQRAAIARALTGEPAVLVADEPTTALDVTVQAEVLDLFRRMRSEWDLTIVIVTHDWGVVADVCDRAAVMYAGEVVEQGTVHDLFAQPRHPYTRALLEANPASAEFREPLRAIPGSVPPPADRPHGCLFASRCARRQDDCLIAPVPMIHDANQDHGSHYRCLHPEPTPPTETRHVKVEGASNVSAS